MKRQRSGASKAKTPTTQDKPGNPEIVRKITLMRSAAGRSDGKSERLGVVPFPNQPAGEPPYEVFAIRNHVLEMPDATSLRLDVAYAVGNRSLSVSIQHGQIEVFSSGANWTDVSPHFGFLLGNGDRIYGELHSLIVPEEDRKVATYTGYHLWTKTVHFLAHFRRIE